MYLNFTFFCYYHLVFIMLDKKKKNGNMPQC